MQRADIVQAAAQIFRQKGYHATSMQDIADAVHLQKASLYHHVEGKQDILLEILDHALDRLTADISGVVDSDLSPTLKLRLALRAYTSRLNEDRDLASVLLLEYRALDSQLRARHVARRDRVDHLWRRLVQEGIDAGEFRRVDPVLTSFALLGVQNWMITWFRDDGRLTAAQAAEGFADLFLKGLVASGEAPE
jgi:TetR/AcrR family transcriptional regulator, cholesterol catabolism regulator